MLDANALDRTGGREALVDRFLALVEAGEVVVLVPGGVHAEVAHANTPEDVRQAFGRHGVAPPARSSHDAKLARIRVRAILRGDTGSDRHDADASHVSEAAEAGCVAFITHDRRILRRRDDLRAVLPPALSVLTLERFLAIYEADDPSR